MLKWALLQEFNRLLAKSQDKVCDLAHLYADPTVSNGVIRLGFNPKWQIEQDLRPQLGAYVSTCFDETVLRFQIFNLYKKNLLQEPHHIFFP